MAKSLEKSKLRESSKKAQKRQDDIFSYRMFGAFGLTGILLLSFSSIMKPIREAANSFSLCIYIALSFAAAATICCVLSIWMKKQNNRVISTVFCYISAITLALVFCFIYLSKYLNVTLMPLYISLLLGALLYLIYFIYQMDFFSISILSFAGAGGFWLLGRILDGGISAKGAVVITLFTAAIAACAGLFAYLNKTKGKIAKLTIFPPNTKYILPLATCFFLAVGIIVAVLLGSAAATVITFACFGYWFILAVYYTTKLM